MIGALAGFWIGLPKWMQDALKWIGIGVLIFLFGKAVAEALKAEGARKQREKNERESLKEQVRVSETRREIEEDRTHVIEQAREAGRALPEFSGPGQLREQRPDIAGELFGDDRGGSREGA